MLPSTGSSSCHMWAQQLWRPGSRAQTRQPWRPGSRAHTRQPWSPGSRAQTWQAWCPGSTAHTRQPWRPGSRAQTWQPWRPGSRAQTQQSWGTGLVVPWHVGSFQTRDRTHDLCIGSWISNHQTTREVPNKHFLFFKKLNGSIKGSEYSKDNCNFMKLLFESHMHIYRK